MTMIRKLVQASISELGDDEVEVVISTAALARDGHVLVPQGCRMENYLANPIVLWSHDPDKPVGNSENIVITADKITARVRFAQLGISHKADEVRGLVKTGVIRAVSVGFDPVEGEPLDPKRPRGGQRFTSWELLELSFCSVPVDTGAVVTARAFGGNDMAEWKVGAVRGLSVEAGEGWDDGAAETSIFAWAGGENFDPEKVRKAFLVYNADKPMDRASYKMPIARAVDGKLTVSTGAIEAASAKLTQTDIPGDVKDHARGIIDHYKRESGMPEGESAAPKKTRKAVVSKTRNAKITFTRGMYEVASLCYMFENLGWYVDKAKYEAAIEGDGSEVPAMLAAVLSDLGDALLAMTAEEVAEMLASHGAEASEDEADDEILVIEERQHIAAGSSPAVRAFRRGLAHAKLRAGKSLSSETVRCLREAREMHGEAMDLHRSAMRKHKDGIAAIDDMMERAGVAEDDATSTVETGDDADAQRALADHDFHKRQMDLKSLQASA